jgi:hypothetical protein
MGGLTCNIHPLLTYFLGGQGGRFDLRIAEMQAEFRSVVTEAPPFAFAHAIHALVGQITQTNNQRSIKSFFVSSNPC